jgi:uncharacterized damage-inducible protein DinB
VLNSNSADLHESAARGAAGSSPGVQLQTFRPTIQVPSGYSPAVGHLVSMLRLARFETVRLVESLSVADLAHQHDERSNSIGALLSHLAAVERAFQIISFEERPLTQAEEANLTVGLSLGQPLVEAVRGRTAADLLTDLEAIRVSTTQALSERDDTWLTHQPVEGDEMNQHWIWFHVLEDEIRHGGQIAWLKTRLPSSA